jgi:hypothetical protein
MQSVVPITVLIHYFLSDYFDNYNKEISFEQREKNIELSWRIVKYVLQKAFPDEVTDDNYKLFFNDDVKIKQEQGDENAKMLMNKMRSFYKQLTEPNSISFILEEPEQNLYPNTQVELIKDIVKECNGNHPSTVLITTHSPYVLTAINNLIYAAKVGKNNPHAVEQIISSTMWLSEEVVSAYRVANGTVEIIMDDEIREIMAEQIDEVSLVLNDQYERLSEIEYATNNDN